MKSQEKQAADELWEVVNKGGIAVNNGSYDVDFIYKARFSYSWLSRSQRNRLGELWIKYVGVPQGRVYVSDTPPFRGKGIVEGLEADLRSISLYPELRPPLPSIAQVNALFARMNDLELTVQLQNERICALEAMVYP